MTINRDTYVHDVLWSCGGDERVRRRAPTAIRRSPSRTSAAPAPDVILLPDEPYRFRAAHLARTSRRSLTCRRSGRAGSTSSTASCSAGTDPGSPRRSTGCRALFFRDAPPLTDACRRARDAPAPRAQLDLAPACLPPGPAPAAATPRGGTLESSAVSEEGEALLEQRGIERLRGRGRDEAGQHDAAEPVERDRRRRAPTPARSEWRGGARPRCRRPLPPRRRARGRRADRLARDRVRRRRAGSPPSRRARTDPSAAWARSRPGDRAAARGLADARP